MREVGLSNYQRFHYDAFDFSHQFLCVISFGLKKFEHSPKRPFVSLVILILVFVLLKFTIELVDGIIRQMHVQVVEIRVVWWLVLFSSEPSYPLLMNVDPKRVDPIEQYIDPQVEFEIVDQVRLVDVPLDYASLALA